MDTSEGNFPPKIVYIKGPENVVADAIGRLPTQWDKMNGLEAILLFTS